MTDLTALSVPHLRALIATLEHASAYFDAAPTAQWWAERAQREAHERSLQAALNEIQRRRVGALETTQ